VKVSDKEGRPADPPRATWISRWLCGVGAALGALGLLDAIAGTEIIASISPHQPRMAPNSGLALLLLGLGGVLRDRLDRRPGWRALAAAATLIVLAVGILTIAEYAFRVDLKVDGLITGGAGRGPRAPALPTALAVSLLAAALLLLDFRPEARGRPSDWLVLAAGMIAVTAVLGYVFGAELRHGITRTSIIGVAPPTAIGLLSISVGLLLEHPTTGAMAVAVSPGPGGQQFRRFVLPAILFPVVLGIILAYPLRTIGGDALTIALAVLASATMLGGICVLLGTAVSLNRTYEALEASREWSRTLVEQAPDGVFVADLAGRYTDVNGAACRMLGYSRDEILAQNVADLLRPGDAARLAQTRSQLLAGGVEKGEWDLRRKDGSYMSTEVSAKIFPDGRWQGLVRDISERKRLEKELRTAEAEQKFLADLGSALVATLDDRETVEIVAKRIVAQLADGCSLETLEEDGRLHVRVVVHRDPGMADVCRRLETLEVSRQSVGSKVRAAKAPLLVREVTPAFLDSLAQNEDHRRLLDELAPKSFVALPLQVPGGIVGSLVFFSTTAGQPYTEKDLPFAQAVATRAALAVEKARLYRIAQDAIHLRDDVLSIVAHDLRNPLGTILMQAELLRRRSAEEDGGARKAGTVISRSATRMNRLIQDLLDVARMEGGRLSIERVPVPAHAVVADALQAQATLAASASVELRLDAPRDLPEVWADRQRILQVFENLLGNAIKFTDPGGLITVGAEPTDGQVLFWVADTGAGIGADQLPHVFERLWQGNTAGQQGAGLGLPIARGIVEAHGGHLWVESKVGEGTTFFFTVPAAPRSPLHTEQAPAP
jgi:PAS domain S-box-containing protein